MLKTCTISTNKMVTTDVNWCELVEILETSHLPWFISSRESDLDLTILVVVNEPFKQDIELKVAFT